VGLKAADAHEEGIGKAGGMGLRQQVFLDPGSLGNDRDPLGGYAKEAGDGRFHITCKADEMARTAGGQGAGQSIPEAEGVAESIPQDHKIQIVDEHRLSSCREQKGGRAHAVKLNGTGSQPGKEELFPEVSPPTGGQPGGVQDGVWGGL